MKLNEQINFQSLFIEIASELEGCKNEGRVATYIPELGNIDPDKFGIHLTTIANQPFSYGDANEKFSIQSISKVFSLALAFKLEGDNLWQRVGVEPSGSPFNSLVQLEYENGIPRNPFINAGAIVICDVLVSHFDKPKEALIQFIHGLADDTNIKHNEKVYQSEKSTSYQNCALVNLMKSYRNIENSIDDVLDLYFFQCSLEMTCQELSQTFLFLASSGVNLRTKEPIVSASQAKRINAIMQLCGFYDEAGEFSFKVGLPGKSGVGGGIVAVHPGQYSIAVWSPRLNNKGNSYKGMKVLELITTKTESSIF